MGDQQKGRPEGQPKNESDHKDTEGKRWGQGLRLPRPDALKRAIDPADFYRREIDRAPDFKPQADGWTQNFPCPFHEDKNGSFGVNLKTGAYRCFGCEAQGGSVIDFTMNRNGLDLNGARADLGERYGVEPSAVPAGPRAKRPVPTPADTAPRPTPESLVAIPAEALATRPKTHPKNGAPSAVWEYRNPDGHPLFFVCRFDPPTGRKQFAPLTWTPAAGWQWKAPPEPRPLYRLDRLATRPADTVLFTEGEKTADAAALLFPDMVTTTTVNGAQSPGKADFGPLTGHRVRIWPDNDDPGAKYLEKVATLALAAGAVSVELLDLASLARDPRTGEPRTLPGGWDAADAAADGWTAESIAAAARWLPYAPAETGDTGCWDRMIPHDEDPVGPEPERRLVCSNGADGSGADASDPALPGPDELPLGYAFRRHLGGIVYLRAEPSPEANDNLEDPKDGPPLWVCPPFRILSVTRDERGEEFGRLVMFRDPDRRLHREVIGNRECQGNGDAVRARLAAMGFEVSNNPVARRMFMELLRRWKPERRARSVTRTGWTLDGESFVLPDRILGKHPEAVILATEGERPAFGTRGTLAGWRNTLGLWCRGNSRLTFAVSLAFAAPCLQLIDSESGGFHLAGSSVDASSSGKTTIQRAAASVCGSPEYLQRWRATDNALEGLAELHNDALLVLDELDHMDPKSAGESLHMLGNGAGKARMERNTGGRPVKRWRVLFLSSGEIGLADHLASIQRKARAGQEVRMAEIPADAGAGLGCFEDLHGHPSGAAFAVALKGAAAANYGTPLIAFVEALIRDRQNVAAAIKQHQAAFVAEVLGGIDAPGGQVLRVAARFGLVAVAGDLATAEEITGWRLGAARDAARRCFADWLGARGGAGPAEERALLAQVGLFFERHLGRFRWKSRALDDHAPDVAFQAGFKETLPDSGAIVCYAFAETFRQEIIGGFSGVDAARVLVRHGLLQPGPDGRTSQKVRLPGRTHPVRVYVFHLDSEAADGP